ncbi:glycosyltransferase family 2 protein [Mariniflexile sp.]|uniref:glycosyltransferase family 2 protein n=1 Tax=Mariniflexile sp. TaxID=1979402 RepID=UPI003565320E
MKTLAVILPTYNSAIYLNDSIDSVLTQSFTDFDLYILDDSSTDGTEEIVACYKDSRIVYLKNCENIGISKTLNKGLKIVENKYKFIARMDADDWCFSTRFKQQLDYLVANPNIQMCGTQGYWLKDMLNLDKSSWTYPTNHSVIKLSLLFTACFGHSSVMFRQDFINIVGYYNESVSTCEDWELWTRAVHKVELANLPEFLMKYRIVVNSNHRAQDKKEIHFMERSDVISNHWKTFDIEIPKEKVFQYYYSSDKIEKETFKKYLIELIEVFNALYIKEIASLNSIWKKNFQYKFLRFIKGFWKRSGVSRTDLSIWVILFTKVKFAGKFKTLKSLYR